MALAAMTIRNGKSLLTLRPDVRVTVQGSNISHAAERNTILEAATIDLNSGGAHVEIDNRSPFAALGYFVRDKRGLEYRVVAVRARFAVAANGFSRISESQGDIRISLEYRDAQAEELVSESDFLPFRPRVDFLLGGRITAPDERSANKVHVGFEFASRSKRAVEFGARRLRMQATR